MASQSEGLFNPEIPPDLEHASLIREEALQWLETGYPGVPAFSNGDLLRMAGEESRRWLITRLREQGIGNDEGFSLPAAADALAVLLLRSRGVKFREAVDAVAGKTEIPKKPEPGYGGVWNRLIVIAFDRLRRHVNSRLLGSAVFSLLQDQAVHPHCLVIVKRHGRPMDGRSSGSDGPVDHEYVYRTTLQRPAPSCWVISPFREAQNFDPDQPPTRSEVTSRHFVGVHIVTGLEDYELLLGTTRPASLSVDEANLEFVGRTLDIVFHHFEEFVASQSSLRFATVAEPNPETPDDLQLWLVTRLLDVAYPGSLCRITELSEDSGRGRLLASSIVKPWEPAPSDSPKDLEMLSGYAGRIGVPLVVPQVKPPWTQIIESVESEMRFVNAKSPVGGDQSGFSAAALPIVSSSGSATGALYMLLPQVVQPRLDVEVRVLTVFSGIVGEIIDRQRAAIHSADLSSRGATLSVLGQARFKDALHELLTRTAAGITLPEDLERDVRLPILLLSAHRPDPDDVDPAESTPLKDWLVETLRHLEWRSFLRSHFDGTAVDYGAEGVIGEMPGVGLMIVLGRLVSKDELDLIRNAFPETINRTVPTNAPVRLLAWVLDVPAHRIVQAADDRNLRQFADEVEQWALNAATVVDDVAGSTSLVHKGEWDAALRRIRRALLKEGGRNNCYLYRLAADCSFSLGDWPSALQYARKAVSQSERDLGSGFVRSMCQQADAHLFLGDPVRAWDLYSEATATAVNHPLPRYYRGQGLLLIARLIGSFFEERRRAKPLEPTEAAAIDEVFATLVNGAMDDLTSTADLLDRWGQIPESYQYRNFHLVPTLLGQGSGYLLARLPGPAASRLQSARRSFPKDDLFFREFAFAKCWEQGVHRQYAALATGDQWAPMRERLRAAFGDINDTAFSMM